MSDVTIWLMLFVVLGMPAVSTWIDYRNAMAEMHKKYQCTFRTVVPWLAGDIEAQCRLDEGHGGHHECEPVDEGRGRG
jgi:hypothetical protein